MIIIDITLHGKKSILNQSGLIFILEGKKYFDFANLMSNIKGTLKAKQTNSLSIEWYWNYYGNDIDDTLEGILASDYSFDISLMSEKL